MQGSLPHAVCGGRVHAAIDEILDLLRLVALRLYNARQPHVRPPGGSACVWTQRRAPRARLLAQRGAWLVYPRICARRALSQAAAPRGPVQGVQRERPSRGPGGRGGGRASHSTVADWGQPSARASVSLETVWGWAEHHTLLEIGIQNSTNTAQEKKSRCVLFPCSAGQTRARHGEFWGGTPCQPRDSETRRCGSLAALLGMPPARRAATILFLVASGDAFVAPGSRGVGTQRCSRPVCLRGRCWPARCRLGPPTGSARTATAQAGASQRADVRRV